MPNTESAKKRVRQTATHTERNKTTASAMRTWFKKCMTAVETGDKSAAEAAYKGAVPAIDRSVGMGIMHRNKAARHKSRLNAMIRAL